MNDALDIPTTTNQTPRRWTAWLAVLLVPALVTAVVGAGRAAVGGGGEAESDVAVIDVNVAPPSARMEVETTERLEATVEATAVPVVPEPEEPEYRVVDTILMEVTAYCPCTQCCGPLAHGVTASGKPVSYNGGEFVAADIRLLPFGSTISVPGYAGGDVIEVVDRGGAIRGKRLDVYFDDHQTALKWGRQTLPVQVLERVE